MSDINTMSEILAPAGNTECAEAAINAGADAIYLGFRSFSARAGAENFDADALHAVLEKAHFLGVKVYVAMNTLVKDAETEEFIKTFLDVWNMGADAVILQDVFLGKYLHAEYPEVVLHLSTQAGVCTLDGARYAKECGFSRVILARETPLAEIEKIASFMETEVFVQGALCTCFSGQCYFSSFAGNNSGNRGRCKQPCRKLYSYDREGFEDPAYALSLSDLCIGEEIEKLRKAGVTSFKIEGRMRRAEYVSAAVRYYRGLLDGADEKERNEALSDLKRTYNRGNFTKGLAFGQDKRFLSRAVQGHIGEKVGTVKVSHGKYFVESVFSARKGDAFKILRSGKEVGGAVFETSEKRGFYVSSRIRLLNGDAVFVTTDTAVNEKVLTNERRLSVSVSLDFTERQKAVAEIGGVKTESDETLQSANSSPLTQTELTACFLKRDSLPLNVSFSKIRLSGNVFIAKSCLNAFRRKAYGAFAKTRATSKNTPYFFKEFFCPQFFKENGKEAILTSDFSPFPKSDIVIYKPRDYAENPPENFKEGGFEKYLYYPAYLTQSDLSRMEELLKNYPFDGIYAESYSGVVFARNRGIKVFAGTGFNLANGIALRELLRESCVSYYAISKELDEREQAALSGEKAFVLAAGDIKLMDLCYCPFAKTCAVCDKKELYHLTDTEGRIFPVRRYKGADGNCRFEVYNCVKLSESRVKGAGKLTDATLFAAVRAADKTQLCKESYTSGHRKKSVL